MSQHETIIIDSDEDTAPLAPAVVATSGGVIKPTGAVPLVPEAAASQESGPAAVPVLAAAVPVPTATVPVASVPVPAANFVLAKLCNLFIHQPFTQIRHVICHAPDPKLYASNYRQSSDQNQRQFRRNYRDNSCLFASSWMVCCKFLDRVGAGKFACSLPQSFLFTFR